MRSLLLLVESWIFDEESFFLMMAKALFVFAVILSPLIWWTARSESERARACTEAGGEMVQTGTRTVLVFNAATKTSIPQQVAIIECVIRTEAP